MSIPSAIFDGIVTSLFTRRGRTFWRLITLPFVLIGELFGIEFSKEKHESVDKLPLKTRLLSLPDNLVMAAKSSWRSRERVLAVFAGVFLASLVISTVLA